MSLWECSVGTYPYNKETAAEFAAQGGEAASMLPEEQKGGGLLFWDLLFLIVECPPPALPDGPYSDSFRALVDSCMLADGGARPSAAQLLTHRWLDELAHEAAADLSAWLIIDEP